jgi:hypothetical protein
VLNELLRDKLLRRPMRKKRPPMASAWSPTTPIGMRTQALLEQCKNRPHWRRPTPPKLWKSPAVSQGLYITYPQPGGTK